MTGGGMYEADIYAEAGDDIDEDMFFLHCAVFSPNGRQVATSFDEGPIRIASFEPGSGPGDGKVLKGHLRAVNAIAFSPCGQWIISAGFDKSVRLWNLEQSGQNQVLVQLDDDNPEESDIGCVAFSPIGNQVAAGFSDGTVSLFDPLSFGPIETGKKVLNGQSIITLKYSPCGKQLSLGTSSGVIYLCRTPQLDDPGIILYGHSKEVTCLAYSPCGNWIASGSNDETVRLWYQQVSGREGKKTWSCVSVVYGFFKAISDIVWDIVVPMEFATSCKDGSVRVWRVSLLPVHSDKEEEKGKQEGEVRFVWGSNLGILCAANMRLDAVQGLTSIQQRLLSQRGAEVRE
ncbi:hypothetical protein FBU30_004133 [Linnemannia zychae]|nr:hypothetical protein FBU30_004133 [Linnemannia zychae]